MRRYSWGPNGEGAQTKEWNAAPPPHSAGPSTLSVPRCVDVGSTAAAGNELVRTGQADRPPGPPQKSPRVSQQGIGRALGGPGGGPKRGETEAEWVAIRICRAATRMRNLAASHRIASYHSSSSRGSRYRPFGACRTERKAALHTANPGHRIHTAMQSHARTCSAAEGRETFYAVMRAR